MIVAANYDQLKDAQNAIASLIETKPSIYKKFINVIKLTRQMQFGYQYMGSLIMDEIPPKSQDDYVMSVYCQEIEKLKKDNKFDELRELLNKYKEISYANISKLALGENPRSLVGATVVH